MHHLRRIAPAFAIALALGVFASWAQAGITGSAHDFGQFGWAKNEVCLPCHTPHNAIVRDANGNLVGGPLWNHELSTATYTLYLNWQDGTTETGDVDQNSKLCLSCHDGTVAVDSFGGGGGTQQLTGGLLGTDLSNDHPIGAAAVWTESSHMVSQALRDTARIMPLRKLASGELAVGCTSCHEPHNRKNTDHMLWVNNKGPSTTVDQRQVNGSGLCFNCHKK